MRYVPRYKGPTLSRPTINQNDPRLGLPKPRIPIPSQAIDPVKPSQVANPRPMPAPTGPMTPVRGGGMLPKSLAVMAKKGGTTKLHSIKKSNKKSNW